MSMPAVPRQAMSVSRVSDFPPVRVFVITVRARLTPGSSNPKSAERLRMEFITRDAMSLCIHATSTDGMKCQVPRIGHVRRISRRVMACTMSSRVVSFMRTPMAHSPLS